MSETFIYFIQDENGPIKIGRANNVGARLAILQIGNPRPLRILALARGNSLTEREVHIRFKECQLRNEWFLPCKKLLDFIEELNSKRVGTNGVTSAPYLDMASSKSIYAKLYIQGFTLAQIGHHFGVSRQSVQDHLRLFGTPRRGKKHKRNLSNGKSISLSVIELTIESDKSQLAS